MHRLSLIAERISAALCHFGLIAAAASVTFVTLLIAFEILLRALFNTSTFVLEEFVGYGVASMTFLGMGGAFRAGAHVRVTLLIERLNGRLRIALELVCLSVTAVAFAVVGIFFVRSIIKHYERGTVSNSIAEVPLWLPQGLIFLGVAIFLFELANYFLRLLSVGNPIQSNQLSD